MKECCNKDARSSIMASPDAMAKQAAVFLEIGRASCRERV